MAENLLRFSPEINIQEKGVLIEGQLSDGSWQPVFSIIPDLNVFQSNTLAFDMFLSNTKWQSAEKIPTGLVLQGDDGLVKMVSQITMRSHDMLRVDVKATVRKELGIDYIKDNIRLLDFDYESAWTPLNTPEANMVIGDLAFHSSGIVLQKGARQIALMPNFKHISANRRLPLAMSLNKEISELSFGYIPYDIDAHDHHVHNGENISELKGVFKYSYFIYYQNNCKPKEAIRRFVHRSWRLQGEPKYLVNKATPVKEKAELLIDAGADWLKELDLLKESAKIYNDVQASSAQSAFAMACVAKRTGQKKYQQQAKKIIDKIVAAPRVDGLFPALYDQEWQMGGIAGPAEKNDFCRLTNCSWTAYWLSKWYLEIDADDAVLEMLKEYGQALVKFQRHGGHIPSWIRLSTLRTVRICAKTAEVSVHGLFLNKLYLITKEEPYLKSARRVINFIIREVLPKENWQNTEIYYENGSCQKSPKKQNDGDSNATHALGLWWTAESLLELYKTTGTHRYIAFGQRILDRLSYFQQLWDIPWIEAGSFGGFGRSNCSNNWNDSIQSFCAKTYLDYYRESGLKEYYQRGVSALSAAYGMLRIDSDTAKIISSDCILTNPAKPQVQYKDSPNFEMISGKVLTASEMIYAEYGDLYVDTKRNQAFAFRGLEIRHCNSDLIGTAVGGMELNGVSRTIVVKSDLGSSLKVKVKANAPFEIQI